MRLRLLVASSLMPLTAIMVWALGGTSLGVMLTVLIVFGMVVFYALALEGADAIALPPPSRPVDPRRSRVHVVEGSPRKQAAPLGEGSEPVARSAAEPQRPAVPEGPPEPDRAAELEQAESDFPPITPFERPASLLAGIASRVQPQAAGQPGRAPSSGRWNVWALERLATERLSKEGDYERSMLIVYLRDFASSDGTLPPEFNGLVESAFPDLIGDLAQNRV
ncbi:MAG: hypothetical protein ACXVZ1_01495 [Gaiellaceae bacterium]